ncbi:deoxyguanosinetriphosphate triphosphohydrolase [Inconstantimicrobium mannanitabidum]|uniref:Deoxyguanosinetriphosphate triphosphohydrolase n=1 Tax=Inconstantimicrobium mannanitabidum TaxID=1604901 RepID=A0ACB5R9Q3_9CLOT|nr:deoxyguanosinetriphosphate triphosphohydrolase [Clostridium sp. TW13]GKX65589.1 deoxyguanosinetriphosphate triphosphohydrolase [Clostridium sp. TW13]
MNIREKNQSLEELTLIKEAKCSKDTLGRVFKEQEDDIRTVFMVDRDRIIHCKSFRRLKHKTQVFIKTSGDHYRTRLTHTIEVSQIARTIAVGIRVNEYLAEAIAMGHDLGHVAFAHTGESVLNSMLKDGFRHNEQSVRIVSKLENDGKGLNLTREVIDGILNHSGFSNEFSEAKTLEGQIVRFSDKIAYVNHDIDDSIRAGLLSEEELPKDIVEILGKSNSERIDTLVHDLVNNTIRNIENNEVKVSLSKEKGEALAELRKFMFKNIYLGDILDIERKKASFVIENVVKYYFVHPEQMPLIYRNIAEEEGIERGVADYIAGMSDDYCLSTFNKIYVPKIVVY